MLVQIYTIISLLVFIFLVGSGSSIDGAMLKSFAVFAILIILTRISVLLIDIIREAPENRHDANTKPSAQAQ
ncbi:hypothetical protein [Rhodohalobacter mucosus]|uniref:Uncharacterized protein n=1 Tax=Rhodohalobacter mucosus TaxID=2079485 RepID=A0A316TNG9_9BACT|nr:hypothetical protein [Rhodohalobacter mucosus]PWN05191.1 hypothetical protein DDZ15_15820 [Rhodohalobacter mucosus]